MDRYAELHCRTNFSFLAGASDPEALIEEAARLGLHALAVTDRDGFYGVVRFALAAREVALPTVFGCELGGAVVLAAGPAGHARLARAISEAQLRGEKGAPHVTLGHLAATARAAVHGHGATEHNTSWFVLTGTDAGPVPRALLRDGPTAARFELDRLVDAFGRDRVVVELWDHNDPIDRHRNDALAALAARGGVEVVATNDVRYATPSDRRLADALCAIRARESLDEADAHLAAAPFAHLRSATEQARRFARWPGAVERTVEIAEECAFDLRMAAPNLPDHEVPSGHTEMTWLRELTRRGAAIRYPVTHPQHEQAMRQIEHELGVIGHLGFPGYFLVLVEIVDFCRRNDIYCQGRGSAANSAVCYALGITKADAVALGLLFERFLSVERDGPPDIDVDIEHQRREEVIQYLYDRHGRDRCAQVANVITYRSRSALREMAKACGMSPGRADALAKRVDRWSRGPDASGHGAEPRAKSVPRPTSPAAAKEAARRVPMELAGSNEPANATREQDPFRELRDEGTGSSLHLDLAAQVLDAPRHLGIHSGGMVMADRPLIEYCPVEWARMDGRSVLQWDKEDCAAAGLVKFDLLGLGMLTMLHLAVDLIREHEGIDVDLATIPQEDAVYDLLCAADTVGVFQVESRAQMATLPRLRPRTFYDLVVEVALIRPGPIQGGSVHPYLRRRTGEEEVTYLHPDLEPCLKKTLGVPLFQEQLMQMAIDVAGFSPGEADQLRQAMGSKRSRARMARMRVRLLAGMAERGIVGETADAIATKLEAFADFGFPESHSVSFAYLVYSSAWVKFHHPAEFTAALLNAQPMGFYSPHTLIRDGRRHGVEVLGPDINASRTDCTLEPRPEASGPVGRPQPGWHADPSTRAVRVGLRYVRGLSATLLDRIEEERSRSPFVDLEDLTRRTAAPTDALEALAAAGAFEVSFALSRRAALWAAGVLHAARPRSAPGGGSVDEPLPGLVVGLDAPALPGMTDVEETASDLWAMGLSPGRHPTEFVRAELDAAGVVSAMTLRTLPDRSVVEVAGLVTHRQQPATSKGTIFINLEDETGLVNVICPPGVWKRFRTVARRSPALRVRGMLERRQGVVNLVAARIAPLPLTLADALRSRDFR